jgi:hypothetical protein
VTEAGEGEHRLVEIVDREGVEECGTRFVLVQRRIKLTGYRLKV